MAPMDDPMVIAARYATIARKMVNDAAQVAIDAFDKINKTGGSTYTAADAIESMTTLAGIAISGGSALARIPLQIQPDNGPMLVADEVAAVITRALTDATAVAGDAAEEINDGTFRANWVDSAVALTGMAVLRAAEAAEAIGAGPGVLGDPRKVFPYTINGVNLTDQLVLKMASPLARPDVADEDIARLVRFDPDGGVLKAGRDNSDFSLTINCAGIPSGIYLGQVEVLKTDGTQAIPPIKVTLNL
jgi:hypothetical protein